MSITIADPLTLPTGQRVKNRLVKAAMTEGLSDHAGRPTSALIHLYQRWADGGAGLLLTGNIQVDRLHLERAGNVIVDREPDDFTAAQLRNFANAGKRNDTRIWAQISHAGRQSAININGAPKGPSAIRVQSTGPLKNGQPVALTEAEIIDVIERFVRAARVLKEAGFDGVQIHSAHGYLLSQFLSPKSNVRADRWGGSLENRARLLLEVVRRIKALTGPEFGLAVKLNSADFQRGGFDTDDSVKVARWLDEIGIDFLEVSGGTYEAPRMVGFTGNARRSTQAREAYFLEFAPRMRAALTNTKLMVTGGFRSVSVMNDALSKDGVDLIGIGRPLCVEPDISVRLVAGTATEAPRYENMLRLGPGLFSQKSPLSFFRRWNGMLSQPWYYSNIVRLSEDRPTYGTGRLLAAALSYRSRDAKLAEKVSAYSRVLPND